MEIFSTCELIALQIFTIGITMIGDSIYQRNISKFKRNLKKFAGYLIVVILASLRIIELLPEFELNKPRGGWNNAHHI